MRVIFVGLGVLVFIFGLGWIIQGNEFFMYKFFAPKRAEVERQVFEHTRSYNQGMIQELDNMRIAYIKGTPEQRDAMRSIIIHRSNGFNLNDADVPSDLREFIENLRKGE